MRRTGSSIPLYSVNNTFIKHISVAEAYALRASGDASLSMRGRGANAQVVAAKLRAPRRPSPLNPNATISPAEILANAGLIGSQLFMNAAQDKVAAWKEI